MSDLLDAVDALTKPQRFKQMQDTEVVTVELPPLLLQLDEAIRSSMGGNQAGASAAHESSIVNSAALFKLMQISTQVTDWGRKVGSVVTRGDTSGNLRRWYAATLAGDLEPAFYILKLGEWANAIRNLLDPPRQKDLPDACPACDATDWWKDGERYLRPLIVTYRPDESVDNAKGMCRACARVWNARELSREIELKHAG